MVLAEEQTKRSCKSKMDLQNQTQSGRRYSKAQRKVGCQRLHTKTSNDFYETFSPVARPETIRTVIVVVAQKKQKIFQLDVKSAFMNEKLDEEIYVEQLQGFFVQGAEEKVYRLKESLYRLKQVLIEK